MKDIKKYQGVIPAFYACYDAEGNISTEGVKALTRHLIAKGVKGVYVGGSSGECIYQHVDERKAVLEAAGASMADVIKTTVFLQSMGDFAAMNAVYAEFFTEGQYPARSAVEVGALPRGALVEIETICVK